MEFYLMVDFNVWTTIKQEFKTLFDENGDIIDMEKGNKEETKFLNK